MGENAMNRFAFQQYLRILTDHCSGNNHIVRHRADLLAESAVYDCNTIYIELIVSIHIDSRICRIP